MVLQREWGIKTYESVLRPTGLEFGFAATAKGFKLIPTMPETMTLERRKPLKILGTKLVLTEGRHRQGRGVE